MVNAIGRVFVLAVARLSSRHLQKYNSCTHQAMSVTVLCCPLWRA